MLQPIGICFSAVRQCPYMKDYVDPPLVNAVELKRWSFYRALIAKFLATFLFLCVVIATVIGHKKQAKHRGCGGILGMALAFGSMIFVLVYCAAVNSGAPIDFVVMMEMLVSRKGILARARARARARTYVAVQCLGTICGVGMAKTFMTPYSAAMPTMSPLATPMASSCALR